MRLGLKQRPMWSVLISVSRACLLRTRCARRPWSKTVMEGQEGDIDRPFWCLECFFVSIWFRHSLFLMYCLPYLFSLFLPNLLFVPLTKPTPDSQTQWSVQSWRLSKLFLRTEQAHLSQLSTPFLMSSQFSKSVCVCVSVCFCVCVCVCVWNYTSPSKNVGICNGRFF